MKCTVTIDKAREEEIIIYAHERTALVEQIEQMVLKEHSLHGYYRDEIKQINTCEVYCFSVIDNKLYAITENKKYLIKLRLYQLEELLDGNFIKINQSSIANILKIKKFDASFSGTLKVIFKNGYGDYVSRRNIKKLKERIGLL